MSKKQVQRRDGIYQRPDAKGFWGSWTDAQGRRRRRRFDAPTLMQARALLEAEKLRVEEQVKFGRPTPTDDTFAAFAVEFLRYQEKRIAACPTKGKLSRASYERQKGILESHLTPHFGPMKLALIRKKDVAAYITRAWAKCPTGRFSKK